MKSYIGVTGFVKSEEVTAVQAHLPIESVRPLAVGVLASWKSLRGRPIKPKWQKRIPDRSSIKPLFSDDPRLLNLIHYCADKREEDSLLEDLLRVGRLAGPNLHGIQLNIAWPALKALETYRVAVSCRQLIILQISQKAVELTGGKPQEVAARLTRYWPLVDGVLLDPSGGRGQRFNPTAAREFLSAIAEKNLGLGLGVAGGLGPETLNLVEPLLEEFPNLSINAEDRLRDANNDLDLAAVSIYLTRALQFFG